MTPQELDIIIGIIQRAPMSAGEAFAISDIFKREQRSMQIAEHKAQAEQEQDNGKTDSVHID